MAFMNSKRAKRWTRKIRAEFRWMTIWWVSSGWGPSQSSCLYKYCELASWILVILSFKLTSY